MLLEEYRNQGFGKALRDILHDVLSDCGFRKVYATVPANSPPALRYLIGAGYKLEAHLKRHYHTEHDEFVLGFNLTTHRAAASEYIRQIQPVTQFSRLTRSDDEAALFLKDLFPSSYCDIDSSWAQRQIREAVASTKGRGSTFRKRAIYVGREVGIAMLALCVFKRGGAVKLLVLTRTAHQRSVGQFIRYIEQSLCATKRPKVRKVYTHVPIADTDTLEAFYSQGFHAEGVLERPYTENSDMVALAKNYVENKHERKHWQSGKIS
jgi:hypothetical protein